MSFGSPFDLQDFSLINSDSIYITYLIIGELLRNKDIYIYKISKKILNETKSLVTGLAPHWS